MNNIAIVTARSGSKGLKDKNILPLAGMPLIAYSIIAARESRMFKEIMVSTDSEHYASLAKVTMFAVGNTNEPIGDSP